MRSLVAKSGLLGCPQSKIQNPKSKINIRHSSFVIRQSVRRSLGEVGSSLLKKPHHRSLSHALSPAPPQVRNPKVPQGTADSVPPCLWDMPRGLFDRAFRMRLLTFSFSESQLFSFFPHPPPPAESGIRSNHRCSPRRTGNGRGRGVGGLNRLNHGSETKRKFSASTASMRLAALSVILEFGIARSAFCLFRSFGLQTPLFPASL